MAESHQLAKAKLKVASVSTFEDHVLEAIKASEKNSSNAYVSS